MSDPSATNESAIPYSIHYDPDGSELPRIPRKPLMGFLRLKRPGKAKYRPLHAKFIVGAAREVVYDLKVEHDLHFHASAQGTLRIELYAQHKDSDILIASKECALSPPAIFEHPVRLDIEDERLSKSPLLKLEVMLPVMDENFEAAIDTNEQLLSVSDCLDDILQFSKIAVKIGGALGELLPVSQSVFALLELGVDALEERMKFHDDIRALVEELRDACEKVKDSEDQEFKDKRTEHRKACNALVVEIFRISSFLRSLADMNLVQRSRSKINERVQEMRERLRKLAEYVKSGGALDMQSAMFRVEEVVSKLDNENTLGHLPIAKGMQAGSSKGCLPDTRTHLLTEIMDWAFDQNGARCFLLHGAAGMGKSAVAHSVARILADTGNIIAPFFAFDRNEASRQAHQLYPTLAENLARYDRQYLESLRSLRSDQLKTIDILDQHKNLMLSLLQSTPSVPIVFIVDALDECPDAGRKFLLNSLRACVTDDTLNRRVRFFMTTRPYKDICETLPSESELHVWKPIDDIHGTEHDIRLYVASQLANTKVSSIIDVVATASQAHFECAAVLCRELTDARKPRTAAERKQFIEDIQKSPGKPLYNTYRTVLSGRLTDSWMPIYRRALAWVLAARDPQPLSVFLDFAESFTAPSWREDLAEVLTGLGSLLSGTRLGDNTPIRPLHTSFRDYVLNAKASGVFAITSEYDAADSQLALACFRVMGRPESGLRCNTIGLPSPFIYKGIVENLDGRLTKHVSPALRYACREVSAHLSRCDNPDSAPGLASALKGFLHISFLFWVEACGWLGYEPCDVLQDMLGWAEKHDSDNSAPLVSDFISFAKRYREAISSSPPQVYIAGLLFAPVNSHVSRLYRHCITGPIEISGYEQEKQWPPGETLVIQAGSEVYSVSYSPDGTKIVAGLYDNTLRIWDARTGRQVGDAMQGHTQRILSVAVSPDGSRIASGSRDHTVRLWNSKTSQQRGEVLRGHTGQVRSVAFSPDGVTVVSSSDDCTLRLWNAQTGKEMGDPLEGHMDWVRSVVFSHDGTRIISGADNKTVRIWETATHQQLGDPIQHEDWVMSVAISRDDTYIACGSKDGTIRVWDIEGRQQVWALRGHEGWVFAVAFSPDSMCVVSGGDDNTVRIWEAASGKQVGDDLRGHANVVYSVAFSPDGRHVASGSSDHTVRVWDVREVKEEGGTPVGHTAAVFSVACSSDGKYIASGSTDKTVRLWDAQTGQPVGEPMTGHDGEVNCVTFSPDSTRAASASDDRTVRVWDVTTRLLVGDELRGHEDEVLCIAFSPDDTRLVSGSADKTLRLWDLATGQQIGEALHGHENRIRSVSFSSDGLCIASGSDDGSIRLWDAKWQLQTGKALKGHGDWVRSVASSPDDAFLVSGSDDRTIRLWDTHTGDQMGEPLTGHSGYVLSVSFSLDGKYIVSGSADLTVRVWNVQTRQQVGVALQGHEYHVNSVAFTSDRIHIISGSNDSTIRAWDYEKWQSLRDSVDATSTSTTRTRAQATLEKESGFPWNGWMVHGADDNGDSNHSPKRPLLWIPHHLQHYQLITSPYQILFVPPVPHIRITVNDTFHLEEWPIYTPAPAADESLDALGLEE